MNGLNYDFEQNIVKIVNYSIFQKFENFENLKILGQSKIFKSF